MTASAGARSATLIVQRPGREHRGADHRQPGSGYRGADGNAGHRTGPDEAAAKAAELRFPGPWEQAENTDSPFPSAVTMYDSRDESVGVIRGSYTADHIALHDPARVLRDVKAGRDLLAAILAERHELEPVR